MSQDLAFLAHAQFATIIQLLLQEGYRCLGPKVENNAIVFGDIKTIEDLPKGVSVEQGPGMYRIIESDHKFYFAWANGPQALKPLTFAAREPLWSCRAGKSNNLHFDAKEPVSEPVAVIGIRPCDLAALYIHDRHFLQQEFQDPYYLARRKHLLLIAVNCTHPAPTCFCASTGDGPKARFGYDFALTELDDGFVINAHSEKGQQILQQLPTIELRDSHVQAAQNALQAAKNNQQRKVPSRNLSQLLSENMEHVNWSDVAERCLSCGNCTAVCPTCFCHRETELAELDGSESTHYREWDSCFSQEHSYIHGISIRADTRTRYRQWLSHKFGSWHAQYGRSGCVGCGRCISWCPVGIDVTEELSIISGGKQ